MSRIVGIEIAMYIFHHSSINNAKIGKTIKPIDQKNSNTSDVIIFAAPFVISPTIISSKKKKINKNIVLYREK